MPAKLATLVVAILSVYPTATNAAERADWWNPKWRLRTTVCQAAPCRSDAPRPVEVAIDFPLLLKEAGVSGEFDPASLRVVERSGEGAVREVPFARRTEPDVENGGQQTYLTWIAHSQIGRVGEFDVYFDTKDRGIKAPRYDSDSLPPENLLANPGFEEQAEGLPAGWKAEPKALLSLDKFARTTGRRSLKVVVDKKTPESAGREFVLSQQVDVGKYAGGEVLFECDLLAERAAYGVPVSIELQQFRADGSRIPECAIQPRWLTLELARGQLVQFRRRGRLSHEAAAMNLSIRMRCYASDADTRKRVTGPESHFTVWLDRVVVRPAERLPWPAESWGGFVEGALAKAPLNRGFEFTGLRRLAFNGASEGTLTTGRFNPDPKSVHWGLASGTLEFWCRPAWNADDGREHVFFDSKAYGHRLQCRLAKGDTGGKNRLEFTIADAGCTRRTVGAFAPLQAGKWHHVAATWDFPKSHLQLFVDGKRVASEGPGTEPWPSSLVATGGKKKTPGIGISQNDTRSMPMQAFLGGNTACSEQTSAEAVIDEFRISDVARYAADFKPEHDELAVDEHTRVLFHFENERHGVHDSDDRFVRGHLACELARRQEEAPLEVLGDGGRIERRMVSVEPRASRELFEKNRVENRLTVTRPFRKLPDPRFVECRNRQVERTVTGKGDEFTIQVGGDFEPLMRAVTFERMDDSPARTTLLPRWRAGDNVVPLSFKSLADTVAAGIDDDVQRAFQAFKYALAVTNYYDAHYCETLPCGRHRPRISYSLIKAINIYPFDQCGPLNYTLRKLFLAAGISSNDASGTHHQFEQAYYGGRWRLFDLSPRKYWLRRDNATVVGRPGFEDDLYLKLRQGDGVTSGIRGRKSRARYGGAERPHNMGFPLRPGERASVCWHNEGRWFEVTGDRRPIPLAKIPPYFGNGAIVYQPTAQGEAAVLENMVIGQADDKTPVLKAKDPANAASLVYRARCPYIFSDANVDGIYRADKPGAITLAFSPDRGKSWNRIWQNRDKSGRLAANLLNEVTGRYAYWLKVEFAPGAAASITGLKVRTTLVASPLALPGKLSQGANQISFVGAVPTVPVKTTCRWVERYKSDLGASLNAVSYYMNDDEMHRNLFVVAPGGELPIELALEGRRFQGQVSLAGLPSGWTSRPKVQPVEVANRAKAIGAKFVVRPADAKEGEIKAFDVVVREGENQRRVPAQVLVADAPLMREAERSDAATGNVSPRNLAELSGSRAMAFTGNGRLAFDFAVTREGNYALWLRARWEPESSMSLTLTIDGGTPRGLRVASMIGFSDWTSPSEANTKMFAHFGEQYGHWSWYRIPDVRLTPGKHRLTLGAAAGAQFDAMLLLPQNAVMDRAAMNLFQNWNYAPWRNPL